MKTYTIGVDLGGTNIKAGLVDEVHHIVDSVSCKTNLPRPEHEVEAEIAALCSQLAQRAGLDMATQIESVGIGTPGDRAYGYRQGRAPLYVRAARLLGKICFRPCAG